MYESIFSLTEIFFIDQNCLLPLLKDKERGTTNHGTRLEKKLSALNSNVSNVSPCNEKNWQDLYTPTVRRKGEIQPVSAAEKRSINYRSVVTPSRLMCFHRNALLYAVHRGHCRTAALKTFTLRAILLISEASTLHQVRRMTSTFNLKMEAKLLKSQRSDNYCISATMADSSFVELEICYLFSISGFTSKTKWNIFQSCVNK